jgi:hypothetical protein
MLAPGHKSSRDYVSDRVFDGVRPVSADHAAKILAAHARIQTIQRRRARGGRLLGWLFTFFASARRRLFGRSPRACRDQV